MNLDEFVSHPVYSHIRLSRDGRVWSDLSQKECFGSSLNSQVNYRRFCTRINQKTKFFYIHRLVAETFIPNPHNYPDINHINGNKEDNRVSNLEWCSRKTNMMHCTRVLEKRVGKFLIQNKETGEIIQVTNLTLFCEENKISRGSLYNDNSKIPYKVIQKL